MRDARNVEVQSGDFVIVLSYRMGVWARPKEAMFSHYSREENLAFYLNPDTGRLNRARPEHVYKVPPRP